MFKTKTSFLNLASPRGGIRYHCQWFSAQPDSPDFKLNTLYFDALGQGILYSFNYDSRITESIWARIGNTNWSMSTFLILPSGLPLLRKNASRRLDLGSIF